MERVEEKVRVKLHLESLQLRLRELCFQLRGAKFSLPVSLVITVSIGKKHDEQINAHALRVIADGEAQGICEHVCAPHITANTQIDDDVADDAGDKNEQGAREKMREQAAQPSLFVYGKAPDEIQHERGRKRPEIAPTHLNIKRTCPGNGLL